MLVAACGDKVNIIQPPGSVDGVSAVTVAPNTATMTVGATVSFSAIVTATGAAATTVTWSSTDASKVSVSATGLATAVAATPGVAICATSTVNANAKGCASVSVTTSGGGNVPASISIASITGAGGLNVPVPVPPGSVGTSTATGGQLDVRMNLTANSLIVERVDVLIDGVVAGSQTFTAAQVAEIQAQLSNPDNQFGIATIVISIAINACKTGTGATLNQQVVCGTASTTPAWLNGTHTISARATGHFAGAANGSSVSNSGQSIQLLFANASGFIGTATTNGINNSIATAAPSVVDLAGFKWVAGALTVTAKPVIYTGQTVQNVTITFGSLACQVTGLGTRTSGVLAPSADGTFTFTWSSTATASTTGNVRTYSLDPAAVGVAPPGAPGTWTCAGNVLPVGEAANITAVGNDNDAIVLAAGGLNGGAGFINALVNLNADPALSIRLDNNPPSACTFAASTFGPFGALPNTVANAGVPDGTMLTINGRTNGWLNGAATLNTVATSTGTADRLITGGCTDTGSGRLGSTNISREARASNIADANSTTDAAAAITTAAGLAETGPMSATVGYRLRLKAIDLLGNNASQTVGDFSVDLTPPVLTIANTAQITVAGGGGRFAVAPAAATIYTALDNPNAATPAIPASGFFALGGAPLYTSINRRDVVNGNLFYCSVGTTGATSQIYRASSVTSCTSWVTGTQNVGLTANGIGLLTQPNDPLTVSNVNAVPANVDAYYTELATIVDQAANSSAAVTNTKVLDATAPSIGGLSYPPFLTAGGPASFQSTTIDNLDLWSERMNLQFDLIQPAAFTGSFEATVFDANTGAAFAATSDAGGSTFWYPDQTVNAFTGLSAPATLISQHAMNFSIASLITQWQMTGTVDGTNGGALNANGRPNTANGFAVNQAGTAVGSGTPIIPGALPGAGAAGTVAITATGAAGFGPERFVICGVGAACPTTYATLAAANVTISRDGATAATPTTVAINAVATGVTGFFTNPFSQVQFYAYMPGAGANPEGWRLIGSQANAAAVNDGGLAAPNGRNWTFSLTWDPTAVTAPNTAAANVYRVLAVGIGGTALPTTSQGVALASPIGAVTVTVVP